MAFDDLPSSTFLSQGTLCGGEATVPDRIVFAYWPNIYETSWDYTVNPATPLTGDSAVGLYWNPKTLAAGKKVEYVTYYGLGNVTQSINPDLSLSVTAPLSLTLISNSYSPIPFTVITYAENPQDVILENVSATISLPTGLTLATGSRTQNIGILNINETKSVSWQVMAADQNDATILTYVVSAIANHVDEKTVTRGIEIPALKSSGIDVLRPTTHTFYLDWNGNGRWDGGVTARAFNFGLNGDKPVSGVWG